MNKVNHQTVYTCCGKEIHSKVLMAAHLELVHGIDIKTQQFEQKMLSHLDAADWYSTLYQLTGGGVTFGMSTTHKRTGEDALLWKNEDTGPEVKNA
jgi:hypothetical protein